MCKPSGSLGNLRAVLHGGGGGEKWIEGRSDWRNPAGDASLFLSPDRAGDAECHFGLCDGGPFAPCALLERPLLRQYAHFLSSAGVRTSQNPNEEIETEEEVLPRALESAIRSKREILSHALLVAGASATGDLIERQPGTTPLHWAATKCTGNLVELLVSFGASVMLLGSWFFNAFHCFLFIYVHLLSHKNVRNEIASADL